MIDDQYSEQRKSSRKEVFLPIKLFAQDTIVSLGQLLDISCYGVKLEVVFVSNEERASIEKILAAYDVFLEIGEKGDLLYIKIPVHIRWTACETGEGEHVFRVGMDLVLTEEQEKEWNRFYNFL